MVTDDPKHANVQEASKIHPEDDEMSSAADADVMNANNAIKAEIRKLLRKPGTGKVTHSYGKNERNERTNEPRKERKMKARARNVNQNIQII